MVEVYKCLSNIIQPLAWDQFKQKDNPFHLRNTQLLELSKCRTKTFGLNTTLFKGALLWNKGSNHLRKQNPFYISETKFENGQGGHVLFAYALKLSTFKKCTYVQKVFKVVVIYLYFQLLLLMLVLFIFS